MRKVVVRFDSWRHPAMKEILGREPDLDLVQCDAADPARAAAEFGRAHVYQISSIRDGLPPEWLANAALLERNPNLLCVSTSGAGYDTVDVGAYGLPGVLLARGRTVQSYGIKGLASLSTSPFRLFTNKPGITSVADIGPGDRVAVTAFNNPQAELVRMAAEKAFGDAHRLDAQMVSLPHPEATAALISANTVTLYMSTEPFSTTLGKQPGVHLVTDSRAIMGEQLTSGMLATTARFMDGPGRGAALVAALAEADKLIQADPKQAAAIYLQSEQSKLGQDELTTLLRNAGANYDVQPSGTVAMAAFMLDQGELKQALPRWQDAWFAPVSQGKGS